MGVIFVKVVLNLISTGYSAILPVSFNLVQRTHGSLLEPVLPFTLAWSQSYSILGSVSAAKAVKSSHCFTCRDTRSLLVTEQHWPFTKLFRKEKVRTNCHLSLMVLNYTSTSTPNTFPIPCLESCFGGLGPTCSLNLPRLHCSPKRPFFRRGAGKWHSQGG